MSTSRPRRWILRGGSVLIALVSIEILARLIGWPQFPSDPTFPLAPEWSYPRYIARDTELFWRYRPDQNITGSFFAKGRYRINAQGFRGPEFGTDLTNGHERVVCLGGSTTFGLGVSDGQEYPRQLESQLNHLDPEKRQWDVLNLGVTNYSTAQGVRLAEQWLPRLHPSVVVLNFTWGDHQRANGQIADEDRSMPPAWMLASENTLMRSATVQWACRLWLGINPPPPADTVTNTPVWRVGLSEFSANIERLATAAQRTGARCVVVSSPISWPPPGQSDTTGLFHYHHRYHRMAKYASVAAGADYCEVADYFNLHPEFYDIPPTQYELFNSDGHTLAGNLIARCILGLPLDSARVFDVRKDLLPHK